MATPFSFGSFGQPAGDSSSSTPASNPFASTTPNVTNTQPGGLFGGTTAIAGSAANPFGGLGAAPSAPKTSLFGNTGSNPGSGASTPSLFGASTGIAGGSSVFGGANNTTSPAPSGGLLGGSQGSSTAGGLGGGFSFGTKKDEGKGTSTPVTHGFDTPQKGNAITTPGLFGSKPSGSSPFAAVSSSGPPGSTTPAATKPSPFNFGSSTTPAGPPPTDNTKAPGTSLFGSVEPSAGGLFSGTKQHEPAKSTTGSQPGSLFASSTGGSSLFSNLSAKPATSDAAAPSISSTAPAALKPTFTFPSSTSSSSQPFASATSDPNPLGATSSGATTAPSAGPSFVTSSSKAPTISTAPTATPSLFGNAASTSSTSAATTAASGPTLFSGLGKLGNTNSTTATAPGTSGAIPAPLFGGVKKMEATNPNVPASSAPDTSTKPSTAPAGGMGASTNAPSTAGPAPQLSRLKNKTMDEIIMRWASDLSLYQKEFQDQAAKVASWDRLLVENGDKIQKLYTSTFEAERASGEVERQLANVENQQDELAAWLTRYESEVDKMFDERVGDSLHQGPDQERERTYKLAEKLTDRLDEMGRDLSNMIQEINNASASLSKTNKSDDPLSQIVRVLNGHLSQLQWIDQNAAALQAKVAAVQKAGQTISANGHTGGEFDAADDFYRTYMNRR